MHHSEDLSTAREIDDFSHMEKLKVFFEDLGFFYQKMFMIYLLDKLTKSGIIYYIIAILRR